jgi:hypothetical protein
MSCKGFVKIVLLRVAEPGRKGQQSIVQAPYGDALPPRGLSGVLDLLDQDVVKKKPCHG